VLCWQSPTAKIVEGVRVEKITVDGKTVYKTVAVKTTTKTVDKGEPLGTASITLASDVIMLYPILTPVVLVTGGVGLVASIKYGFHLNHGCQ
jgi:hypothetical protein